jgi:hypothetical protein
VVSNVLHLRRGIGTVWHNCILEVSWWREIVMWEEVIARGLLPGIVASLTATVVVALASCCWHKWTSKRKFGKADGTYEGYEFKRDDKGQFTWEMRKNPASKARIAYRKDNILSITLESLEEKTPEGDYLVWDGEMVMELENFGTIAWRYRNLPEPQHRFGFKRCIIREESDKIYVYLIGEEFEGYGKEVLIRDKARKV